ncbi:MAG: large-conductance mechanosensitive channel protein MscL [Candidatus Falkowbacteria bacterium]|nr:large-conductance mechanosensitive channel protein MscL [Candidatus Falkowbacteria bacterium]
MKFIKEFKAFMMRGSVVDLAVAVIIGGAFGKIVSSLVADVIMPLIGILIGGVNFTDIKIILKRATIAHPAVIMNIGTFLQNIFDFLIIATAIFIMIKLLMKLRRLKPEAKSEPIEPEPTKQEMLLTEIRDLLQK